MKYRLEIEPAIPAEHRHLIEDALKRCGYSIVGGGTTIMVGRSSSDVSFERPVNTDEIITERVKIRVGAKA